MTRKSLQVLFCVAAAAVFGAYGTAALAIAYDVGFDPSLFGGSIVVDIDPGCFSTFPSPGGGNTCGFDVTSVNFTDGLGRLWDIAAPEPGIGQAISVDGNDKLTGIAVSIFDVQPVAFDNTCDGNTLSFFLNGTVTFNCGGNSDASASGSVTTIVQIPEPATLALLGVGLGGYALTRRRKRNGDLM